MHRNRKRVQVVNGVLYRQFFDHTGLESHEQLVVPEDCILKIVRTLHNSPVQGRPGLKKMLYELRKRYYSPNLACEVQKVLDGCEKCMKSKSVNEPQLRPPLQKIYDPCDGPEDMLEIDIVGPLPASNSFTHILTAVDVFSRYLFAVPLKKPDTHSVAKGLLSVFTKHAYVPKHILTDKGTVFTAELLTEIAKAVDIHISHATIKHAQTIGMVERTHANLKKILKISVNADRLQCDRYVDIAIMAHNTTYHDSLKCSPTDFSRQDTFYRSYFPRLADKFCNIQELIKKNVPLKLSQQHKDAIFQINESLLKATKVSLKLPLPDKQLVRMCDASEHVAGYVLLIEDYADSSAKHTYAPVAFGSKKFQGGQMSLTMYAKKFLAMHFAFDEFGHIFWGAKKPIIVMTDNKALTRFFQAKHIPPSLWNF